MEIRKTTLSDVKEINDIRNYYIENTLFIFRNNIKSYDEEYSFFKDIIKNDYPSVTLIDNGEVVGFSYVAPFRAIDGYNRTMELSIYLKDGYGRNGYGKKMLEEIENLSKDRYHVLVSVVSKVNDKSISFHEKNGFSIVGEFKEIGRLKNTYLDVTFMQKILN